MHRLQIRVGSELPNSIYCSSYLLDWNHCRSIPLLLAPRRMGADEFLVDVGAPTRGCRQYQMSILDDRRRRDDLVLPLDVVDVDLHDLEVWYGGAEMRADQTAEMAVETDIHQIPVRFGRFSAQSARTTTKFERWLIAP